MPESLLLTGARVLTPKPIVADCILIEAGRIAFVGQESKLNRSFAGLKLVHLRGNTVVPGFNDCHMHILPYGLDLTKANLSPAAGVTDIQSLIAALRRWSAENSASEWILGGRYDQNVFPDALHPTRYDLDAAFPDRPVWLLQTSKHAGVCNTRALKLAGITRESGNPAGGEIVRDAYGEPTGVLLESAMGLVERMQPRPDRAGLVAAIRRANEELVKAGITSASDLNTGWFDMRTEVECYFRASEEGAPVRTTLFPDLPELGKPDDVPSRESFLGDFGLRQGDWAGLGGIRLGAAKLFSDGALTVRTAALREEYVDGSGLGMLLHPPEELSAYVNAAHVGGWQLAIHAIGDRAIDLVLNCYQEAQARNPRTETRHRIEHAMLPDEMVGRFCKQGIVPVIQPEFITRLGDAYVLALGEERASRLNPVATFQQAGLPVPFSSDCPIVPGKPLDGIRASVRRVTRTGRHLGPHEEITPDEALSNYTYWAAYASFDEAQTGTIAPGMRADLAILSGDPTDETALDSVDVVATIIAGRIVSGSDRLA